MLGVQSQIFSFRNFFLQKLLSVKSLQKVDFCISLSIVKNSDYLNLTGNLDNITFEISKNKENLFFHVMTQYSWTKGSFI